MTSRNIVRGLRLVRDGGASDATFGFMHEANLEEGALWPTAFALQELTAAEEANIGALVKKAVS